MLGRVDKETAKSVAVWKRINSNVKAFPNDGVAMSLIDGKVAMIALIKSNTLLLVNDEPFVKLMEELFRRSYGN